MESQVDESTETIEGFRAELSFQQKHSLLCLIHQNTTIINHPKITSVIESGNLEILKRNDHFLRLFGLSKIKSSAKELNCSHIEKLFSTLKFRPRSSRS